MNNKNSIYLKLKCPINSLQAHTIDIKSLMKSPLKSFLGVKPFK